MCEDGGGGKGRGGVAGHAVFSAAVNGPFKLCAVVSSHSKTKHLRTYFRRKKTLIKLRECGRTKYIFCKAFLIDSVGF